MNYVPVETVVKGIYARELSTKEFFELEAVRDADKDKRGIGMGGWFMFSLCDANGTRLFQDVDSALEAIPLKHSQDVYQLIVSLSGFGEDVEKNSESPATADS